MSLQRYSARPLTLILNKSLMFLLVPQEVRHSWVRLPAAKIRILLPLGGFIAARAIISGKPSPTKVEHVIAICMENRYDC